MPSDTVLPGEHSYNTLPGISEVWLIPQSATGNVWGSRAPWGYDGSQTPCPASVLPTVLQTHSGGLRPAEPTHGLKVGSCSRPQRAVTPDWIAPLPCAVVHGGVACADRAVGGSHGEHVLTALPSTLYEGSWGFRWISAPGILVFLSLSNCFTLILCPLRITYEVFCWAAKNPRLLPRVILIAFL